MMVVDPIGDLLARIRNAQTRRHKRVEVPYSKLLLSIIETLKEEGFIIGFELKEDENKSFLKTIDIELKYKDGKGAFEHLQRVSKPGVRVYVGYRNIPKLLGGIGLVIMSTPKGVMSGKRAKAEKVGGEHLCNIW